VLAWESVRRWRGAQEGIRGKATRGESTARSTGGEERRGVVLVRIVGASPGIGIELALRSKE